MRDSRSPVRAAFAGACLSSILLVACTAVDGTADDAPAAEAREGIVEHTIDESAAGEGDSSDAYIFARVSGMVTDGKGRLYVADSRTEDVRVFGADGRFLHRIGRKGQGPGEFDGPCCLALRDDDRTLWVRDGGNARYVAFSLADTGATYRSSVRMAHTDVNRWAPVSFDPAGNLIDIGTLARQSEAISRTPSLGRYHLDTAGRIVSVDTIPGPPEDSVPVHLVSGKAGQSRMTFYVYQPYGPSALVAHAPSGEWARAVSTRYSIAWYGRDGRVLRTLERSLQGPTLTARERDLAEESIQDDLKRTGLSRAEFPFDVPDRKPPLRNLVFDQEGRLWVQHSVPDGAPARADVYGPNGRMLFEVTWPVRTDLTGASRGDLVYAVQRDSLDTPSIVRMKLATRRAEQR